jgi:hypothetical protein
MRVLLIRLDAPARESIVNELRAVLGEHPGDAPVILSIGATVGPRKRLLLGRRFDVEPSPQLEQALKRLRLQPEVIDWSERPRGEAHA